MNNIIDKIINEVSLDVRIADGIFDIKNNQHVEYLCEYLISKNIDEDLVCEFIQPLMEKGRFPERQAYNRNGILVTFPTPEYKQRAIKRGTHFEKDPRAAQSNLFGGGKQAPNAATPPPTDADKSAADAAQLPPTDSNQPQEPVPQKEPAEPVSAAPSVSAASAPSTEPPAQGQLASEPTVQAAAPANVAQPAPAPQPPPAIQKTPQEIEAEKLLVKNILNSTDTLPTVAGVGGVGITEELKKLIKVAIDMELNEAVKFLTKHIQ